MCADFADMTLKFCSWTVYLLCSASNSGNKTVIFLPFYVSFVGVSSAKGVLEQPPTVCLETASRNTLFSKTGYTTVGGIILLIYRTSKGNWKVEKF